MARRTNGAAANQLAEQRKAAAALIGKTVRWASGKGDPFHIEGSTSDGMVIAEGFSGVFGPHLFVVVEDQASDPTPPDAPEILALDAQLQEAQAEIDSAAEDAANNISDSLPAAPPAEILAAGEGEVIDMAATVHAAAEQIPADQPLPGFEPPPPPPFDQEAAAKMIEAKEYSSAGAWADYDRAHKQAQDLKKRAETEDIELHELIRTMRDRREKAQSQTGMAAAVDRVLDNGEARKPGCIYEMQTGLPCAICRAKNPIPPTTADDWSNPNHPDHSAEAKHQQIIAALGEQLREVGYYLERMTLEDFDEGIREDLAVWASAEKAYRADSSVTRMVFPTCLLDACEAAAVADGQRCRVCNLLLWDETGGRCDETQDREPYPTGARVGIECGGAKEEARPIKKTRKRDKSKKHDPEQVAADQRAAAPKDEATA